LTGCARKPKWSVKRRQKAIKCENIFSDILIFGSKSDILNPRWFLTSGLHIDEIIVSLMDHQSWAFAAR
jgi:hypothetical protein